MSQLKPAYTAARRQRRKRREPSQKCAHEFVKGVAMGIKAAPPEKGGGRQTPVEETCWRRAAWRTGQRQEAAGREDRETISRKRNKRSAVPGDRAGPRCRGKPEKPRLLRKASRRRSTQWGRAIVVDWGGGTESELVSSSEEARKRAHSVHRLEGVNLQDLLRANTP